MLLEEWKPIKGFDEYEISTFGQVRSRVRVSKASKHGVGIDTIADIVTYRTHKFII